MRKNRSVFLSLLCLSVVLFTNLYPQSVRPAARAGQFYPEDPGKLQNQVNDFLNRAFLTTLQGTITAIWVPHAGYVFSGQIAGNAYAYLQNYTFDAILVLGPSHYFSVKNAAAGDWDQFASPLGLVSVDRELSDLLVKISDLIDIIPIAHKQEHAIEVQLPFIQTVLPDIPIVPIVVGQLSYRQSKALAHDIVNACKGKNVLLIASSDMSHYPAYDDAVRADRQVLKAVENFDARAVYALNYSLMRDGVPGLQCVMCGHAALVTVMLAAKAMQANEVKMLPYANSGDVSGERNRVVGYGSALFVSKEIIMQNQHMQNQSQSEDIQFSKVERMRLFQIARESIRAALENKPLPEIDDVSSNLNLKRGVFVTLTNKGRLRGCIGNFSPYASLVRMVQDLAAASATQDYRFAYNPVTVKELANIDIKISILSELQKVDSADEIIVGKHGIWIKQGNRSGTFLPEVASEMHWNREEFLTHCCADKAGLSPDAWKNEADIYVYTSQILNEKDL